MRKTTAYLLLTGLIALGSCSGGGTNSDNEKNKFRLESWLEVNGYDPSECLAGNGIYLLESTSNPGGELFEGGGYVFMDYTVRNLDNVISSTSSEALAKQTGKYSRTACYGPVMQYAGENSLRVGIEDMLLGMRTGETRKALIPSWLMSYTRYSKPGEYIKHSPSNTSNAIYEITLRQVTGSIFQWESDSVSRWMSLDGGNFRSVSNGLWMETLEQPSTREMPSDTTVYINYTGRRLDGQVFDTTIKDTAIVNGIYSGSRTYKPVKVSWSGSETGLLMGSSGSSLVRGFSMALYRMHPYEKARAVMTSDLAYSSGGSGNTIPAYSPLIFEVELTDEP